MCSIAAAQLGQRGQEERKNKARFASVGEYRRDRTGLSSTTLAASLPVPSARDRPTGLIS
jgi:hypothetical protein